MPASESQYIEYNGAFVPIKRAIANVAASQTDSSVVAAVTGKKLLILAYEIHCGGTATNLTFNTKPSGSGTAISPLWALGANSGRAPGWNQGGWYLTGTSEGLTVTTGAGSTCGVAVLYAEVVP